MDNEEKLIIGIVTVISIWMIIGSRKYVPRASYFPITMAAITLFFMAALLVHNRLNLETGDEVDLLAEISDRAELDSLGTETDDEDVETAEETDSEIGVGESEPGEFRINQPTVQYSVPFTDYEISTRIVLSVLLVLYLGFSWLFGIFYASVLFVLLYGQVMQLRRNVFLALIIFTVLILLMFGLWLETPLFRPTHDLFTVPGVRI